MKYTMPEIEFIELKMIDVITTSSGNTEEQEPEIPEEGLPIV